MCVVSEEWDQQTEAVVLCDVEKSEQWAKSGFMNKRGSARSDKSGRRLMVNLGWELLLAAYWRAERLAVGWGFGRWGTDSMGMARLGSAC